MSKDKQYCDDCADEIADNNFYVFTHSPVDFDSGWKGESAIFCVECYDTLITKKDKPENRKVYLLIGKGNKPSIARGNTWAESEVTDKLVSIKVVE